MAVVGGAALRNKWSIRIPAEVIRASRKALETGAAEYVAMMRGLVGSDDGNLAASIGWTWGSPPKGSFVIASSTDPDETVITIYAGDETTIVTNRRGIEFQNALIQEFGAAPSSGQDYRSSGRAANPFFFPTHRALKKRTRSRITRSINKAIKSNG